MEFRKKTMATLLIAILMISAFALSVSAASGDITSVELDTRPMDGTAIAEYREGTNQIHLKVTQEAIKDGDEARIRIHLEPGTTLGDIQTISWDVLVLEGYRPHVDIYLDLDGDITCLVAEYAQANGDGVTSTLNKWLSTFEGGSGLYSPGWTSPTGSVTDLTTINGETAVWESLGVSDKLSDYQTPTGIASTRFSGKTIDEDTLALYLEIEIDDWVAALTTSDAEACVRNIRVNGVQAPTSGPLTLETSAVYPKVSFTITPSSVDFSTVILGGEAATESIEIFNTGDLAQIFTVELLEDTGFYASYLKIDTAKYGSPYTGFKPTIAKSGSKVVPLELDVPLTADPGEYSGLLVFWAEPTG